MCGFSAQLCVLLIVIFKKSIIALPWYLRYLRAHLFIHWYSVDTPFVRLIRGVIPVTGYRGYLHTLVLSAFDKQFTITDYQGILPLAPAYVVNSCYDYSGGVMVLSMCQRFVSVTVHGSCPCNCCYARYVATCPMQRFGRPPPTPSHPPGRWRLVRGCRYLFNV